MNESYTDHVNLAPSVHIRDTNQEQYRSSLSHVVGSYQKQEKTANHSTMLDVYFAAHAQLHISLLLSTYRFKDE